MTLLGRSGEYHTYPPLESAVIAGGAAGDLTVTGIKTSDTLKLVQRVDAAGANLASEFTITAADTVNNTGGTDTTGMLLLFVWYSAELGL